VAWVASVAPVAPVAPVAREAPVAAWVVPAALAAQAACRSNSGTEPELARTSRVCQPRSDAAASAKPPQL
jgi:hypothetical protein